MKVSNEIYQRLISNSKKQNKYYNKKVIHNNIKFDSIKEQKRYTELKLLEKAKLICELELQKVFELQPSYINNKEQKIRRITYKCDFFYYDKQRKKYIVEDVKGIKTEVYKLKKKMFEYKYPNLTIDEI